MDDANHQLSMSAFCALFAVAFNTMVFQSGRVLGFPPPKQSVVCRILPVFCAFAAVEARFRLGKYSLQERSLKKSLTKWIEFRFPDTQDTRKSLGWNSATFIVVLLCGALAQAIKIFATQNVTATKVACASYLSSYGVDALIISAAPIRSHDRESALSA